MPERPPIVCLCGSTKFRDLFIEFNRLLTLEGNIVLTVGFFGHAEEVPPTDAQKLALDELHLRKIDLADEVFFLNPDGYIGDSGRRELAYAIATNKQVVFFDSTAGDVYQEKNAHALGAIVAEFLLKQIEQETK